MVPNVEIKNIQIESEKNTIIAEYDNKIPNLDLLKIHNLMTNNEIDSLLSFANHWEPTSITGMRGNYIPGDTPYSYRFNAKDPNYANILWDRIKHLFNKKEVYSSMDYMDKVGIWQPIGISDVFRIIKYPDGGYLIPHYDAPFKYENGNITLKSLVINLDNSKYPTRFLDDPQASTVLEKRDLSDKMVDEGTYKTLYAPNVQKGAGIIFPHRRLHDTTPVGADEKIILRTDIIYKEIKTLK